jgi:hypothetical protein
MYNTGKHRVVGAAVLFLAAAAVNITIINRHRTFVSVCQ